MEPEYSFLSDDEEEDINMMMTHEGIVSACLDIIADYEKKLTEANSRIAALKSANGLQLQFSHQLLRIVFWKRALSP